MKRSLTLSLLAVAVSLSAVALTPSSQVRVAKSGLKAVQTEGFTRVKQQRGDFFGDARFSPLNKKAMNSGPRKALGDPVNVYYYNPSGTFYSGHFLSEDTKFYSYPYLLLPVDAEVTWRNISAGSGVTDATAFTWQYYVPGDEDVSTAETKDLTVTYPFTGVEGSWAAPSLASGDATFKYGGAVHYGGTVELESFDASHPSLFTNYNPRDTARTVQLVGAPAYGDEADFAPVLIERNQIDADNGYVTGYMQHFLKPAAPYTVSKVDAIAHITCDAGAKLSAQLLGLTSDGKIDNTNPLATTTLELPALTDSIYTLHFEFSKMVGSLRVEDPQVIDGDLYVYITGVNDGGFTSFNPIVSSLKRNFDVAHDAAYENHAFVEYEFTKGGEVVDGGLFNGHGGYYWGSGDKAALPTDFMISINADFTYLKLADGGTESELELAVEGETKELALVSSRSGDDWTISGAQDEEVDLPEWLSVVTEDVMAEDEDDEGNIEEYFDGDVNVSFEAEALPEGVKGRKAVVYLSIPGRVVKVTVKQGEVEDEPDPGLPGDVDGNGIVNGSDVTALYNFLLNGAEVAGNADVDGNGTINGSDVTALYNLLLK